MIIDALKGAFGLAKKAVKVIVKEKTQQTMVELELAKLENTMMQELHKTIQAEIQSGDPYVRRWRPRLGNFFTYTITFSTVANLVMQWVVWVISWVRHGYDASLVGAMPAFDVMALGLMLSALGINIGARSVDKYLGRP